MGSSCRIETSGEPPGQPGHPEVLRFHDIESSPLATVFTQGDDHVVYSGNLAFWQLVGRSPAQLTGQRLADLFDEPRAVYELFAGVLHSGVTQVAGNLRHVPGSGRAIHGIAVVSALREEAGPPLGLVVQLIDTTEQALASDREVQAAREVRQANEALILAGIHEQELCERATELCKKAEQAARTREHLLAIVAHDLRTPLGAMLMSINLLLTSGEDKRAPPKALAIIKRTAEGMSRLIQDLLDAASIEAGHLSIEPQRLALAALLTDAIEAMAPLAVSRSLQLVSELPAELPEVRADPVRLQQVLANLLGNAIKFTPAGGTVTVRAECLRELARVTIRDTGPGIAPEHIPHLFERFWQASPSTRLGTGLGLFIARSIIDAHGGKLWVESQVGEGSTFGFTLSVA